METPVNKEKIIQEAEIYYKLSEEIKHSNPLVAYFVNLHGLRRVARNLPNDQIPLK